MKETGSDLFLFVYVAVFSRNFVEIKNLASLEKWYRLLTFLIKQNFLTVKISLCSMLTTKEQGWETEIHFHSESSSITDIKFLANASVL